MKALACVGPVACVAPQALVEPGPRKIGVSDELLAGAVPPSVDTLGRHLLKTHPDWFERDALLDALALTEPPADDHAWLHGLNDSIAKEVEAGDFVRLAGWQLTPTECRVYALAALCA